jgi:hypothetical protein
MGTPPLILTPGHAQIIVVDGMHLDEWTNGFAKRYDKKYGRQGVPLLLTRSKNEGQAPSRGWVGNATDMFPPMDPARNVDEIFAQIVSDLCDVLETDLVLDVHGHTFTTDVPFFGRGALTPIALGFASLLGSENAIVFDEGHPAATIRNYVGWDLAMGSPMLDITMLHTLFKEFIELGEVPPHRPMQLFKQIGALTIAEAEHLGLKKKYDQFEPLPSVVSEYLGRDDTVVALFFDADQFGKNGYYGEVGALAA